ncbi:MAG: sigma-70 family RNA polymerase sigma factor [Firmicutes bacterium]|nr:sigma-70 family RNA polymerase sigma factor [Bacillota bacterium]
MLLEIRGIEKLSWRERQVVALKESGHSTENIAKRLGIGEGTVATLYNRARKKGYAVVLIIDGDPLGLGADMEGSESNDP